MINKNTSSKNKIICWKIWKLLDVLVSTNKYSAKVPKGFGPTHASELSKILDTSIIYNPMSPPFLAAEP